MYIYIYVYTRTHPEVDIRTMKHEEKGATYSNEVGIIDCKPTS